MVAGSSPAGPTLKHFHLEVLFYFSRVLKLAQISLPGNVSNSIGDSFNASGNLIFHACRAMVFGEGLDPPYFSSPRIGQRMWLS